MCTFRKFSKDERGVSAVEFALLLPVLILILWQCGRCFTWCGCKP
ncbi:pilus assembly protein [Pseudochrobactrum algeriensis]|nr:pilus assembly protein [Pseudochrobactrum algeriensis]